LDTFLSEYTDFTVPLSFNQCPMFIFISVLCQKDKRAKPVSLHAKHCSFEYQGALERNALVHCFSKGASSVTRQIACFWLSGLQSGPHGNDDVRNLTVATCARQSIKTTVPVFLFCPSSRRDVV